MSHATFIGTRARLQRLSDAQFFSGWVRDFGADELLLQAAGDYDVSSGDKFLAQLSGKGVNALINVQLGTSLGRELRFRVTSPVKVVPSNENVRFVLEGVVGTVLQEGQELAVTVTDVSARGAGIVCEMQFEKGAKLDFSFEVPGGTVSGQAQVKYSRHDPNDVNTFRTGLQLLSFGRIDQAKWEKMLELRPWATTQDYKLNSKFIMVNKAS